MGVKVRYGSFYHDVAEAAVSITAENVRNEAEQHYETRYRWVIKARALADNATDLQTKVDAIVAAYSQDGQDLAITLPDGTTDSSRTLLSSQTVGGVRVIQPPHFPDLSGGPAMITGLDVVVVLEGDVPVSGGAAWLSFNEQITFTGGGPRFGYIETLTGTPQAQTWRQQTIYRATQSGRIVGYMAYPVPPAPIWPTQQVMAGTATPGNPRRRRGVYTDFPLSYSYSFESASPLIGQPHIWTV